MKARTILLFLLLMGAGASGIPAQTMGGLRGTVTDENGRPLEGVTIVARSKDQAIEGRGAVSDVDGRFVVATLPPGTDYEIAANFPGFAPVALNSITVQAGQATLVRIALMRQSEGYQERVQVHAAPPIITLQDTTTQSRFTSEFIDALPLLGRNYQDLLALAPGVSDVDGDGNPNIHGARDTDVVTLVDGVSTTDPLTGKVGAQLNIDSIQEIEVKTSGATAEFSRAQGGFANIITKSGGNQFEGNFKVFYRGSALDGDGAGIDDPSLHGGLGENGLRDLNFHDLLPFLSLSGPIVKDKAWFFLASEYVDIQEPVNALSAAFVAEQKEFRQFAKFTWQAAPNHRLALSVNYDPQKFLNQGLNSFTREESSYVLDQGGLVVTGKWVGILGPYASLETSISGFDERPSKQPTLDPDTNGNRVLWSDRNGNGFGEASEYDPGEDYDGDGAFDVYEDFLPPFGVFTPSLEDRDHDGIQTPRNACEGATREDRDCDGRLDFLDEDMNGNGVLDPGEDRDGDGRLDDGTEDRNNNFHLDDTPHPQTTYPYGELVPRAADRFYTIDQGSGRTSGPYYEDNSDRRQRFTLRQDLTLFVPDFYGSHDLKTGLVLEKEQYHSNSGGRPIVAPLLIDPRLGLSTVRTLLPAEASVHNEATSLTTGVYVQDAWKPFPNLSIGLGVRFDREATDSFGYTPFDPRLQRLLFDRINTLRGGQRGKNDLLDGNDDGLDNLGIQGDPFFSSGGAQIPDDTIGWSGSPQVLEALRVAALSRLTRHHLTSTILSAQLSTLFPQLRDGGQISTDTLASLGVTAQQEEPFRLTNNNLAPRLSVAWDPFMDGRTKVFATWGRYYDKLFLNTITGEEGPDTVNRYYLLDEDGVTGLGVPNRGMGVPISKAPPSATQVDRGLQTPWSDELSVGFERELAPELALSITYVARQYRQQLQDIDVNHELRYLDGVPIDHLGRLPSTATEASATDPSARQADGRPDLYINNFFFNQILRVGNYNSARYRGLTLEMIKRLSRKWELQGSYTYSRAQGAAEDFQSRLGNDPSTVESEYGYLDFDQRHVVKLSAGFFLPRDWQLGITGSWGSGLPYSVVSRFFALDNVGYQQFRTRYGETVYDPRTHAPEFQTESRNDHRNNAVLNLGGRARKTFVLGRNTAGIFMEVFNILNTDDLHLVSYDVAPAEVTQSQVDNSHQGPLQLNGTRQFGRRFQIGFQIDF